MIYDGLFTAEKLGGHIERSVLGVSLLLTNGLQRKFLARQTTLEQSILRLTRSQPH